ncbi:MAG: hypothetical protein R3185_04915 [Candidatus Thermoplasmatota archaeon]|nr:hypothetical protein [Candidatus Thermoplasmatota archaeon]
MSRDPVRFYFACVGNSGRSIMAEAICQRMGADHVECRSGGSDPYGEVLPQAAVALAEIGIDPTPYESKPLDEAFVGACDLVITMGCGEDACPACLDVELEDWPLEDPKELDIAGTRAVRDEIGRRVRGLLKRYDALAER